MYLGLNPVVQCHIQEQKETNGKTFPSGFYHAVLTKKEMEGFDCQKKVRNGKTIGRFMFQKWDKAMVVWTKEGEATSIDLKSIIQ